MRSARLVVVFALAALGISGVLGCTSFGFKDTSRGSAPDELKTKDAMVKMPTGTFEMGALNGEADEYPPHKVQLASFFIDKTEVTAGDYGRCVQAHACRAAKEFEDDADVNDRHPVTGVSWYDAKKYCDWVGKRLPTEAEWEFAARAPKGSKFPWEGRFDAMKANVRGDADGYARTAPVGSFPAGTSGLGVLDLAGNVAEWTSDWYEATYYVKLCPVAAAQAPKPEEGEERPIPEPSKSIDCPVIKDPKGPEGQTGSRVVRGGSWSDNDYLIRTTVRLGIDPNISNDAVGFRCATEK